MFGKKKKDEKKDSGSSLKEKHHAFLCTLQGTGEINIENYGSLGDYSDKKIILNGYKQQMIIEGEKLLIEYFTDVDMHITGRIRAVHFQ